MSATVTGVPSAAISESASTCSDGEVITSAAAFVAPIQKCLDNSLRALIYVVADIAALKAIVSTGLVNGERLYVQGFGLYEWRASSAVAEQLPYIVDSTSAGNGRWYMVDISRHDRFQDRQTSNSDDIPGTAAWYDIKWATVQGLTHSIPACETGEMLEIDWGLRVVDNGTAGWRVRLYVEGAERQTVEHTLLAGAPQYYSAKYIHTVAAGGTIGVKLQFYKVAGGLCKVEAGGTAAPAYLIVRKV
jgi:hypothetical protein